jgi:hypothetical protein
MATYEEHRDHIASIATTVGRLSPNASPAERDAFIDEALADQDHLVEAMATTLLYRLGADTIRYPAAA